MAIVAMGPRNRRRLVRGAIGLGVVAAIAAAVLATRSPNHSGQTLSAASGGSGGRRYANAFSRDVTRKLLFGMTQQQVLQRVGKPAKTLRDQTGLTCWEYAVNQSLRGQTLDAVRVCFDGGRYSIQHSEWGGKWDYGPPKKIVLS